LREGKMGEGLEGEDVGRRRWKIMKKGEMGEGGGWGKGEMGEGGDGGRGYGGMRAQGEGEMGKGEGGDGEA
jgi:hypothetical protein